MKCQSLFFLKSNKNISLLSADLAKCIIKVNKSEGNDGFESLCS